MTQAPSATVFDFMTRGQIKEFHEVFGRYIDWCAAQGLPQAASEPTDALNGNLWSFLRSTLSQGGDILIDYQDRPYEECSARLDLAARERVLKLHAAMAERPAEGGSNG